MQYYIVSKSRSNLLVQITQNSHDISSLLSVVKNSFLVAWIYNSRRIIWGNPFLSLFDKNNIDQERLRC